MTLLDRIRRPRIVDTAPSFGFLELHGGGSRVVLIPELGGKIAAMELGGRQWLWTSDVIPYRAPVDGSSYVETADSGGYDECFPTVGACNVPTSVGRFGGLALPDHGELWAGRPAIAIATTEEGHRATFTWSGRRMPYRFSREILMRPDGTVEMQYVVRNDGQDRLPFIWSAHPLLPLTEDTRLELPEGACVRVWAEHGITIQPAEQRWPRLLTARQGLVDFSLPMSVPVRYACKLFLDMPVGRAAIVQQGARLEVEFNVADVPQFGLWINKSGWTPFRRGRPYLNIAFEPCIGAPDTLSEALGGWRSAAWLGGGESRSWTLRWRGH